MLFFVLSHDKLYEAVDRTEQQLEDTHFGFGNCNEEFVYFQIFQR